MNIDFSNNYMIEFAKRWSMSREADIKTSERIKLYADTDKVTQYLGGDTEDIDELCNVLIQEFNKPDDKERLSEWIAHNTSYINDKEFTGAYHSLHNLFTTIAKVKKQSSCQFINLDAASLEYIQLLKKEFSIPNNSMEVLSKSSQISRVSLFNLWNSSKENRVVPIFLLLINDKVHFNDFGFCSKITAMDLRTLTNLDDRHIEKIAELFPKISLLFLKSVRLTNKSASSFSKLPLLTGFHLEWCPKIKDISFIACNLPHLTSFHLKWCNKISDLTFLASCQGLRRLCLEKCSQLKSHSLLCELPHLTSLDLIGCTQVKDLGFLRNFPNLTNLHIELSQVSDLKVLQCLPKLKNLLLSECRKIKDLNFLEYCSSLESTHFFMPDFENFSPLANLSFLKSLILADCSQINDLSFLEHCPQLTSLNLAACTRIRDISFLQFCPNLTSLDLGACNRIQNFDFFKYCPHVTSLKLKGWDQVEDITFLLNLPKLRELDLSLCSRIKNLKLLTLLSHLTSLNLKWCTQIKDFRFLWHCPSLTSLNIIGTQVLES